MPEIEFKRARGGKRPGAGRKPNYFKRLATKPLTAAEILAQFDERGAWKRFLTHPDPEIALKAQMYLTDRRDGKPRQAVDVSGGIMHAHTVYRDPRLAELSHDELLTLDALTQKLALPAPSPDAAQDGPQNQSNRAIEAIEVEKDA